jgi:Tol biopolymer transport system component
MIGARGSVPRTLLSEPRAYAFLRLSPDGRHLAFAVLTDRSDIWIYDLPSGPLRRLTIEGTVNDRPEWTPDSRHVLFRSNRSGANAIWIQPADGNRPAELVFAYPRQAVDEAVLSADGEFLAMQLDSTAGGTGGQVYYRRMHGDTTLKLITAATRGQQIHPRFSPNGRWIAYTSSESGDWQVYVKPFPSLDARFQVSLQGGKQPVWSPDGRRLFFFGDDQLLAATLSFDPFNVVKRDTILENVRASPTGEGGVSFFHPNYDVTANGNSFVFLRGLLRDVQVVVVHDWKQELKARTETARNR